MQEYTVYIEDLKFNAIVDEKVVVYPDGPLYDFLVDTYTIPEFIKLISQDKKNEEVLAQVKETYVK